MRSRRIFVVAGAVFLAIVIGVSFAIPRSGNEPPKTTSPAPAASGAAVDVELTVDSIDASSGSMRMRLLAAPGDHLPPDGALVLTSVGQVPSIVVAPTRLNQEQSATVLFQSGDVIDYPFETYKATIRFLALEGTDPSITENTTRPRLQIAAISLSNAAGFSINTRGHTGSDGVSSVDFVVRRSLGTRGWVLAMMAIYWALALGVTAVTALVVKRQRMWETRLLAWLGALLFALVSFRSAAPGSPPVGTFLDFYSVFESVGIVAAALAVLIVFYVGSSAEMLNLPPPKDDRRR
jgi:hypothetical protein